MTHTRRSRGDQTPASKKAVPTTTSSASVAQQADGYLATWSRVHQAMGAVCVMAASRERPGLHSHEALELTRAVLHAYCDEAVDAEMLRHPSPHWIIFRSPPYRQILTEVGGGR